MKRKTYKVRNPVAKSMLEDKKYLPKKVIGAKFKKDKYKVTVQRATEEIEEDDELD